MKIAELESHHGAYVDAERIIRTMVDDYEFPAVFSVCIGSFPHIVPSLNYRKKRDMPLRTLDLLPITMICKYAPPLFEHGAIESLAEFVRSTRVLALSEKGYLCSIETARQREQVAHVLWNHLETQPGALQHGTISELGLAQEHAVEIIELWEELGVIDREQQDGHHRLHFRTQLDTEMDGLCQNCGMRGRGRKDSFLQPIKCLECGALGYYCMQYGDST
jgi:hypothetical protein